MRVALGSLILVACALGSARAESFDVSGVDGLVMACEQDGRTTFKREGRTLIPEYSGTLRLDGDRLLLGERTVGAIHGRTAYIGSGPCAHDARLWVGRKVARDFGTREVIESIAIQPNVSVRALEATTGTTDALPPTALDLVGLVQACPDQEDAGSCLYMSLTGAAEIALARAHPEVPREHDGDIDLSERYLMNLGDEQQVPDWRTDSMLLFNTPGTAVRNRDYRFTKGWAKEGPSGYVAATEGETGAEYGTAANWIDALTPAIRAKAIPVPHFDRHIVFAAPDHDQWATGLMGIEQVKLVKRLLAREHFPIQVVYNHFGYWHSVLIVGYDDTRASDASFVTRWQQTMEARAKALLESHDPKDQERGKRWMGYVDSVKANVARYGLGDGRGVFEVRDSIYAGPADDLYDYDPTRTGEETPYAARIIERDPSWLMHLVNHVVQIRF